MLISLDTVHEHKRFSFLQDIRFWQVHVQDVTVIQESASLYIFMYIVETH